MFAQDTSNDELIDDADKTRLCTWHTITDEELAPVLRDAVGVSEQTICDAKSLIRWCLQGASRNRPTIEQMLQHRLLSADGPPPPPMPMQYHAFLSHAQADASGTASTLFHEYKKLGLHCWLDMKQEQLTLEGMRQGVRDSSVFVLVLSERVLGSWFCQQEMLTAIAEEKPIQLVLEEEKRFHPFGRSAWQAQDKDSPRVVVSSIGVHYQIPAEIAKMVDENLPRAVVYRRRDFEQAAMMRELCRRQGVALPEPPLQLWAADRPPIRVGVLHSVATAQGILTDLNAELEALQAPVLLMQDPCPNIVAEADCVLLLLTAGVLKPPILQQLEAVITADRAAHRDRIVAVFSEEMGWHFGCDEHNSAPAQVKACIDDHEAIAFRPKDSEGANCHEFPAMVRQLLVKLGVGIAATSASPGAHVIAPIVDLRQQLVDQETILALKDAQLAQQANEMQLLRARLASLENVHTASDCVEEGVPDERANDTQRTNGSK